MCQWRTQCISIIYDFKWTYDGRGLCLLVGWGLWKRYANLAKEQKNNIKYVPVNSQGTFKSYYPSEVLYLRTTTCIYSTNRKIPSCSFKAPLVHEFNSRSGSIKVISWTANETKASAHTQMLLACFAPPPLSLLLFLSPSFMVDVWFIYFFASVLSSASKWLETIPDPPDSDSFLALPQSAFGIVAGWCLFDSLIVICFDLRLLCLCLGLKQ